MNFVETVTDTPFWLVLLHNFWVLGFIGFLVGVFLTRKYNALALGVGISFLLFTILVSMGALMGTPRSSISTEQIQNEVSSVYGIDLSEKEVEKLTKDANFKEFMSTTDENINLPSIIIVDSDGFQKSINLFNHKGDIVLIDSNTTVELPHIEKSNEEW